jgi:magnesium transporter
VWRAGKSQDDFEFASISDYLVEKDTLVWADIYDPDHAALTELAKELGLNDWAVEDAVADAERTKATVYRTHTFFTVYAVAEADPADATESALSMHRISAFVLPQGLITVRLSPYFDIDAVSQRFDELGGQEYGVGALVHGLLDVVVDGHFAAVQCLDDAVESIEDELFADSNPKSGLQRRTFRMRKDLVELRRVVLPMREVLNTVMRRDLRNIDEDMMPYYQDVYDHVLRAAEWTESLRDLVTTILETNLTIQGNRMNVISKKVTGWAAIIAVPTFLTGFFGMNLPYPGFSTHVGFLGAILVMIGAGVILYWVFRRNDWL